MKILKYLFILLISSSLFASTNIIERNGLKYFADVILVKLNSDYTKLTKTTFTNKLQTTFEKFGVSKITKQFNLTIQKSGFYIASKQIITNLN